MAKIRFERVPTTVAVALTLLVVAACAIRLRGDEDQIKPTLSLAPNSDSMPAKLEQCRTVSYEHSDALRACQKIWAEKRRQFLGQTNASMPAASEPSNAGSSPALPKDESRLPSGYPAIRAQSE
ncbi:putative entry exclusion protein TrbK-alt [Bradyrhizobium sp. STM 3562]|uniref:putative entry exclusion protein TrbK-alt n=1 Tax=Bradyrhizobium sp. STM 3562 TaxID=578924 RepID=UPI00388F3AE4